GLALRERLRHGLAVHPAQRRLVVEQLQVRRPPGLVEMDDALGPRREVQAGESAAGARGAGRPRPQTPGIGERRQGGGAQAGAEERTAGEPLAHRVEVVRPEFHGFLAYDRVISSGRFRMARATDVQAASSATSRWAGGGAWPTWRRRAAARGSDRYCARCSR